MVIRRLFGLCLVALMAAPALAAAQDTRKVGITIAYPASIGVLWHASDKIAIRPDFTISGSSSQTDATNITLDSDGLGVNFGVSALFYLRTYDRLRTYITPRFSYGHSSTTANTSNLINETSSQDTNAVSGSGSFGAQYNLSDRFSLFGELGFAYSHATSKNSLSGTKGTSNNWGLRSGVGVVFYP